MTLHTGKINWTTKLSCWSANPDCEFPDSGCMIHTGIHAGMVAVTVCDIFYGEDTYYGCIRWVTPVGYDPIGYWGVEFPDDLCCGCNTGVLLNGLCWDGETTARRNIMIVYSGVRRCSDNSLIEINGANICVNYSQAPSGHYALWEDLDGYGHELEFIDTKVEHRVYTETYEGSGWDGNRFFHYTDAIGCTKILANDYEIGDCSGQVLGYGGAASLIDVCDPCDSTTWADETAYVVGDTTDIGGALCYTARQDHTSDTGNDRPETGTNWEDYWRPIANC